MGLDIYFEKRALHDANADKRKQLQDEYDAIEKEINERGESYFKVYCAMMNIDNNKDSNEKHSNCIVKQAEEDLQEFDADGAIRKQIEDDKPLYDRMRQLSNELEEIEEHTEVAYFRKVNLLVEYFKYTDNCTYKNISKDEIKELISLCNRILDESDEDKRVELAQYLLPTTSGFFFGNTDYDEWYFDKLEDVRDKFTDILNDTDWDTEAIDMYCWW